MANPHGYAPFPKTADFLEDQRVAQDYWDWYRRQGTHGTNDWQNQATNASINARVVPAVPAPGRRSALAAVPVPANRSIERRYRYGGPAPPNGVATVLQQTNARVTLNTPPNRADLAATGGLRLVKVLGSGAFGIATLWHFTPPLGAQNAVIKIAFGIGPRTEAMKNLANERDKLADLSRARHVNQRLNMGQLWPANTPQRIAGDRLHQNTRFLISEYARHGDLGGLIENAEAAGVDFPVSVLWLMFQCLVTGVVAMAYPPRHQSDPIAPENGPDLMETIPPANSRVHTNIVHLDLDPTNILMGDMTMAANPLTPHALIPRLQIGDFGAAVRVPRDFSQPVPSIGPMPANYQKYEAVWKTRWYGKPGWTVPEQGAKQWDEVDYEPHYELVNDGELGVAGKFSEATNIHSIGLVMRSLITRTLPTLPPDPNTRPLGGRSRYGVDAFGQNIRPGSLRGAVSITYGWDVPMNHSARVGRDLCELVESCLRHFPDQRPSLQSLVRVIERGVASNPLQGADAVIWNGIYGAPPQPPVVVPPVNSPAAGVALADGSPYTPQ